MALTLGHHLFSAVHENAFNKFIGAYRTARQASGTVTTAISLNEVLHAISL